MPTPDLQSVTQQYGSPGASSSSGSSPSKGSSSDLQAIYQKYGAPDTGSSTGGASDDSDTWAKKMGFSKPTPTPGLLEQMGSAVTDFGNAGGKVLAGARDLVSPIAQELERPFVSVARGLQGSQKPMETPFGTVEPYSGLSPEKAGGRALELGLSTVGLGEAAPAVEGGTALGRVAQGAAEGAGFGGAAGTSQAMQQEKSAGEVAKAGLGGAAGGAILGGGLAGTGELLAGGRAAWDKFLPAKVPRSGDILQEVTPETKAALNPVIDNGIAKGIRPSVSGKGTSAQIEAYNAKARDAVHSIVQNRGNLKLLDANGEEVASQLPESLHQMSQSIEQTKKNIFDKYDALSKAAGTKGAMVDLDPIADELNKVALNPVMQDNAPTVAKYAQERANSFTQRGAYTTGEAQDAIKHYNDSLEAFYKNPSYDTASRAQIDSLIANRMRTGLDQSIEKLSGPGYQDLKNQYGALRSIEKDVAHRAVVDARKNAKGLLDFTDVSTAADLAHGLATMHPASFATAAAKKGVSAYFKHLNNPNTVIKGMFKKVAKLHFK